MEAKGKTLWEMFRAWLCSRFKGPPPAASFYNPLQLRVGALVPVARANGPAFADHDFTVQEIRECSRVMGGKRFLFADYLLRGVNTRTFDADEVLSARLRAVPNAAGAQDVLLLRLYDEFEFSRDFLAVVNDASGIFEVTDDESGARQTYRRVNNLRSSFKATVRALTTGAGQDPAQAAPEPAAAAAIEYWDYWREVEIAPGNTASEFLVVELNSQSGWFQLWLGREFFS